jgi:hypothetical protein
MVVVLTVVPMVVLAVAFRVVGLPQRGLYPLLTVGSSRDSQRPG